MGECDSRNQQIVPKVDTPISKCLSIITSNRYNHQRSKIKYKMPVQAHWWDTAMTLLQRNEILNFSVGMANIYIPFNCV